METVVSGGKPPVDGVGVKAQSSSAAVETPAVSSSGRPKDLTVSAGQTAAAASGVSPAAKPSTASTPASPSTSSSSSSSVRTESGGPSVPVSSEVAVSPEGAVLPEVAGDVVAEPVVAAERSVAEGVESPYEVYREALEEGRAQDASVALDRAQELLNAYEGQLDAMLEGAGAPVEPEGVFRDGPGRSPKVEQVTGDPAESAVVPDTGVIQDVVPGQQVRVETPGGERPLSVVPEMGVIQDVVPGQQVRVETPGGERPLSVVPEVGVIGGGAEGSVGLPVEGGVVRAVSPEVIEVPPLPDAEVFGGLAAKANAEGDFALGGGLMR
ncbi:hypothetical protein, partial [Streptomyces sp. NPDC059185]|uniref:hypothetical protein n=1 Tax=Streptomyces sp. NPDC059185 TaxID=3346762 RepID=UPI0036C01B38